MREIVAKLGGGEKGSGFMVPAALGEYLLVVIRLTGVMKNINYTNVLPLRSKSYICVNIKMRLMIMIVLISLHFSSRSLALSSPPLLPFFLLLSSTAGKKTKSLIMVGQYMVGHTIGSVRSSSFLYTFLSRCLFV